MGLDPYVVRLQQERDDRAKCDDAIAKVITNPINKFAARLGVHLPVAQDDLNKAAREHAPESFDMLKRVMRGEEVVPYPEAATRDDNRTAKVLNLRRMFGVAGLEGGVEPEVNANDIVRQRTAPRAVAKSSTVADVLPTLTREQLVRALHAAEPGSVEFVAIARALGSLPLDV